MSATARPYHHGNLRPALLEAAERALEAGGAQNLSLRELAREVGVSHAAPRRHFADKQALLDALALEGFAAIGATLQAAIAGAGPDFDARLLALAQAYVAYATAHPARVALMFTSKHERDAAPQLAEAADRAFAPALTVVAEGQAAGAVVPGDPERVAKVVFAAVHGLVALANNGMLAADLPLEGFLGEAVERLVAGLRPR